MDNPTVDIQSTLMRVLQIMDTPFWKHWDFWISTVIGLVGAAIAFGAYKQAERAEEQAKLAKEEAQKAKQAATEAGRTVKLQTVCIELSEISQKLDGVYPGIIFSDAKDLFNDTSGHLLRVMAPFAEQTDLREQIAAVKAAIEAAQASLKQVRPTDPAKENEAPNAVYNGIEDNFSTIKFNVATLTGLMEKLTMDTGRV